MSVNNFLLWNFFCVYFFQDELFCTTVQFLTVISLDKSAFKIMVTFCPKQKLNCSHLSTLKIFNCLFRLISLDFRKRCCYFFSRVWLVSVRTDTSYTCSSNKQFSTVWSRKILQRGNSLVFWASPWTRFFLSSSKINFRVLMMLCDTVNYLSFSS